MRDFAHRLHVHPAIITALSSYATAVLGILGLSVRLSVSLSYASFVTKENTADVLMPRKRVIILVFSYQQRLVVDVSFHL